MKFELWSSGNFYDVESDHVKGLRALGFTFDTDGYKIGESTIEINSLNELMAFVEKHGQIVLLPGGIEIYDDWRE